MTRPTRATGIHSRHEMVGSEEELRALLSNEVESATQSNLVIMAGHFMLFADDERDSLVPGIIEVQSSPSMRERVMRRVGIFPTYTWQTAVDLARGWTGKFNDIKFLLLINDWQYVPNEEGSAPELRRRFFDGFDNIPEHYQDILEQDSAFTLMNVLPSRKHPLSFPETWLKYRFQKSAERLVKEGRLEKRVLDAQRNSSEVGFLSSEGSYRSLITCGVTGCAGEVTEMVSEVYKGGRRFMIAFVPNECMQPVRAGVEVALQLYKLSGMKVVVADPGGSGEMTTGDIYEKMVNFLVLESPSE